MRSLRGRITFVTVVVAIVAVTATGLISLQIVRSFTTEQARTQLAAQADILARLPRLASGAELAEKASLALGGTEVALVRADGGVDGPASAVVDRLILERLARGDSVSTVRRGDSGLVMVEARPTDGGGAIVLALPMSAVDRAVGQASSRILLALGIGLIVAIAGGTVLARVLARPLVQAAASARRLAAGERGVPMPERTRTTEVADVAEALSALDRALATSEGRQREFLLSISHELRTPLTAIRGYGEALADGIVDDPAAVGRTLVTETERLDHFVKDLLELARLEADDFSLVPERVDLAALLDEVGAAWAGRAAILGVRMTTHGDGAITTDPRRLRQVLDGLVENAMRAGGASVELRAAEGLVEVLDDGPGLTDEDLAVAFDRGALHARYRDSRPVGTGLGLSIASRLITRMGGTIAAANRETGGARFSVRFG
ncbi:MAG: HAMP domain-containing sensor histidine kinase [Rhodoglobus sp.]